MGANGSKAKGTTETEEGRRWKTVETLSNEVKIIKFKDPKTPGKMPEESHSPNSIYAMMNKNGELIGLKSSHSGTRLVQAEKDNLFYDEHTHLYYMYTDAEKL